MEEAGNCFSRSLENDMDMIIDEIVDVEKTWLAETYRMAYKHSKESKVSILCLLESKTPRLETGAIRADKV